MKTVEVEQPWPVLPEKAHQQVEPSETEAVRKIEQSITYMLCHLDEPLQVATLAARANISPSHFFVLFKRWAGCPPIDYFIRLRMLHACQLLDASALCVKEVAAALGYEDPFYFSRVFKSVNRVAPSEYRMLKNGAKEVVRNGGITLRFSLPRELQTHGVFEHTGSHSVAAGNGRKNRLAAGPAVEAGCQTSGKYRGTESPPTPTGPPLSRMPKKPWA
jgi:AraC-like DNA-binding protein